MANTPTAEQILAAVKDRSIDAAAPILGLKRSTLRALVAELGIGERIKSQRRPKKTKKHANPDEPPGIKFAGDECTIIGHVTDQTLGDVEDLLKERNLNPDDWVITSLVVNKWDSMTSVSSKEDRLVTMRQLKVGLKRRLTLQLLSPARHVPPLGSKTRLLPHGSEEPEHILIEGDHQAPYHDPRLHEASLALIAKLQPHEHIFLGDTMDLPTISRYADHPAAAATPQECIDAGYDLLRAKREASPASLARKLKGNHDWRIEREQLTRAERMYGIAPAHEAVAALDIRRLLHLDTLEIELVTDPRGWEHAEVELVPGPHGLVVAHGWITGTNTAQRSLEKRGRSMIVGHTHSREHYFEWDPSMEIERQAAVAGCMCLVRNQRFPHFVRSDKWLQGCVVVTRWPDNGFQIEHVRWDGKTLAWRNERFS